MCLVTHASLGASDVILGATIKAVCFISTPITTTVSVGCQYALIFVSGYRDFLRKLLDFASPIVRDHYSAPPPPSDACEPCDGYSPMPWKIWVYRNLHLAFSLHDDALAALYARLLHLYIWATLRCLQYRSGKYIVLYVCNFGLIMIRNALYFSIGFAVVWQLVYTLGLQPSFLGYVRCVGPMFAGFL